MSSLPLHCMKEYLLTERMARWKALLSKSLATKNTVSTTFIRQVMMTQAMKCSSLETQG